MRSQTSAGRPRAGLPVLAIRAIGWVFVVGEGFGVLDFNFLFNFPLRLQMGHFLFLKIWVLFHLLYLCSLVYSPMGIIMQSWP